MPSSLTNVTLVDDSGHAVVTPIANITDPTVKHEVEILVNAPKIHVQGRIVKKSD